MKHIVKSIPQKGKIKNGDSFNFYEDDSILIACVADGVGGKPCDWKASTQACKDFIQFYLNEFSLLDIKEGIGESLKKTYQEIYRTEGKCAGMLTTLVAVILDKQSNEYFYFGIGDSLILKFEDGNMEELTPESKFKIKTYLLPASVKNGGKLNRETSFALMTDGFSANRKNYQQEIAFVLHSTVWESKFEEIIQLNQLTQFDDMTLLLLKNS